VQYKKPRWQQHRLQGKWWVKHWSVNMNYVYSVPHKLIPMLVMLADPELPGMGDCTSHEGTVVSAPQPSAASEDGWVQVAESLFPCFGDIAQTSHCVFMCDLRKG
jgi:hypothetical protein